MQTGDANGSGGTGWARRSVDAVSSANGTSRFPASISMAGSAIFCAGSIVQSASLVPGFDLTGVGPAAMASVFPNLAYFAPTDFGFLG